MNDIVKFFTLLLFCLLFPYCSSSSSYQPMVQNGLIDLRDYEPAINYPIQLTGTWKFYWNYLITNQQQLYELNLPNQYITVPAPWNIQKQYRSYPVFGFGTYHITILHSIKTIGSIMYIKMPFTHTAHTTYINGDLVAQNGVVAKYKNSMIPCQKPVIIQFLVKSLKTDIFIQVANYQQRNAGLIHPILYGTPTIIKNIHERSIFAELFVAASLFMIAIYHLGLYFINKSNQNIYLGLFTMIVAFRIFLIDEMLFMIFANPPWGINFRLSYLTITLTPILFCHFVDSVYPNKIPSGIIHFSDIYFGMFTIFVCTVPLYFVSYSLLYIQIVLALLSIYLLIILLKETSKNLNSKRLFYFGLIVSFVCLINDILFSHYIINTVNLSHLGILAFITSQSIVAFEEYTNHQKRLITLTNEINVARNIQKNILPNTTPQLLKASIDVTYIPIDSIGGDFYYFFNIDNTHAGIFIADITGHGIPTSMIASTIYIACSLQNENANKPDIVLQNINNLLLGKTGNQPVSALYCYIDCDIMTLRYASAGHPYFLYYDDSNKTINELNINDNKLGIIPCYNFHVQEIKLTCGDKFFLYTDGLTQIKRSTITLYDLEKIKNFIFIYRQLKAEEISHKLIESLLKHADSQKKILDDITFISVDIR